MSAKDMPPAAKSQLIDVARRYYLDDVSKVQLSRELGLSRFQVARLLEKARRLGVVTITVDGDGHLDAGLSRRLGEHMQLPEVVVVEASGDDVEVRRQVGKAAADLLGDTLQAHDVLGLTWGRTLTAMAASLSGLPPVRVIQLTGAIGSDLRESPVEVVRMASLTAGAVAQAIFAPMLLADTATAKALRRQPDVAAVLQRFHEVSVAVLAIGSWDPPISQLRAAMPKNLIARLEKSGVVAEVAGILIDDGGQTLAPDVSQRCLSISADELMDIPRVLAAAGGAAKARAAMAVARSGLVTSLVTDRSLALAALHEPPVVERGRPRPVML